MGPLGGRGWHPISRTASPLLDVPIPLQIQTSPSPADTPQDSPTPTLSPTSEPFPILPPPASHQQPAPPPIHLPSSPRDLYPSPILHTPLLLAGGHAPALGSRLPPPAPSPPSVSFRGALQLGGPAPSSLALPSRGGGGACSFSPGSTGTPPPSCACLMLLGRRGLVPAEPLASVSRSGKKGGGYRAILRNRLIQEPRLPFNPTGRHCLKWEEQSEGGERLASPEGLVWSLELPSGIAPFPLRGRPAHMHPHNPPPPTPTA